MRPVEQRPKDKPFFLWASSIDPHRPFKQGEYPYKHHPDSVFVPPYYPEIPEIRNDLANYMAYERVAISKSFVYIRNWLPGLPQASAGEIVPTPFYQTIQTMYWQGKLDKQYADSFLTPRPSEELFRHETDIHCMNNLVDDKKRTN